MRKNLKIQEISDILSFSINSGSCLGNCPSFDINFNNDETSIWHGYAYTNKMGKWKGKISSSSFNAISSLLVEMSYWCIENKFTTNFLEGQIITTSIVWKNNLGNIYEHQIENQVNSGPIQLNLLQNQVKDKQFGEIKF